MKSRIFVFLLSILLQTDRAGCIPAGHCSNASLAPPSFTQTRDEGKTRILAKIQGADGGLVILCETEAPFAADPLKKISAPGHRLSDRFSIIQTAYYDENLQQWHRPFLVLVRKPEGPERMMMYAAGEAQIKKIIANAPEDAIMVTLTKPPPSAPFRDTDWLKITEAAEYKADVEKVGTHVLETLENYLAGKTPTEIAKIRILDMGAGDGSLLQKIMTRFPALKRSNLYGLEKNRSLVSAIQRRNFQGVAGSILDMPFLDGSFDVVIGINVMHRPDIRETNLPKIMEEIARVTRGTREVEEARQYLKDKRDRIVKEIEEFDRWFTQESRLLAHPALKDAFEVLVVLPFHNESLPESGVGPDRFSRLLRDIRADFETHMPYCNVVIMIAASGKNHEAFQKAVELGYRIFPLEKKFFRFMAFEKPAEKFDGGQWAQRAGCIVSQRKKVALISLDSDLELVPGTVYRMINHLALTDTAFASPAYFRRYHEDDQAINDHLFVPTLAALFGRYFRNPNAGDFALMPDAADILLADPMVWIAFVSGYPSKFVNALLAKGKTIIDVNLRDRIHKPISTDYLFTRLHQYVEILFDDIMVHESAFHMSPPPIRITGPPNPPTSNRPMSAGKKASQIGAWQAVNLDARNEQGEKIFYEWIRSYNKHYEAYRDYYERTLGLPKHLLERFDSFHHNPLYRFNLTAREWGYVVYFFFDVYRSGNNATKKTISSAMLPLFQSRVLSFFNEMRNKSLKRMDEALLTQAREFLALKAQWPTIRLLQKLQREAPETLIAYLQEPSKPLKSLKEVMELVENTPVYPPTRDSIFYLEYLDGRWVLYRGFFRGSGIPVPLFEKHHLELEEQLNLDTEGQKKFSSSA